MFLKYSFITIAIFLYIYGSIWLFNHINAWIGISTLIGGIIFLGNTIFNKIKSKKDA